MATFLIAECMRDLSITKEFHGRRIRAKEFFERDGTWKICLNGFINHKFSESTSPLSCSIRYFNVLSFISKKKSKKRLP